MTDTSVLQERFALVLKLVEHEDSLTNARTTWTLVFHGLLFSAYANGVGLYEKLKFVRSAFDPIAAGVLLVCGLGILSAVAAYFGLKAAENQLEKLTDWWKSQLPEALIGSYPPLFIHSDSKSRFGASAYFIVLALVWLVLGGILICSPELIIASPSTR